MYIYSPKQFFHKQSKNRKEIEHMMLNMDFVIRLLVAGILGTIIGLDREYRAKEAGYRTHFLVSLGSALIMIVSPIRISGNYKRK